MKRNLASYLVPMVLLAGSVVLVFSQVRNFRSVPEFYRSWSEIGILAFAMTPIVLAGGIDLSVASLTCLASCVLGLVTPRYGISAGCASAIVVGLLGGTLNGILVTARMAPLLVTLGTMTLFAGLAMTITGGERIADLPELIWQESYLGMPTQFYAMLVVLMLLTLIVHGTPWGRYLLAAGENPLAARFASLPVKRSVFAAYALAGLLTGVVAILYTGRLQSASPEPELDLELQVVACLVLGGNRITGGFGSLLKTLFGVAILCHLDRGLRLMDNRPLSALQLGSLQPFARLPETWRLTSDVRLILIGVAVIGLAAWNERLARRTK